MYNKVAMILKTVLNGVWIRNNNTKTPSWSINFEAVNMLATKSRKRYNTK